MNIKDKLSYIKNKTKLKKIKLIVTDVDGVMTDNKIIVDDNNVESKFFNAKDGIGIHVALKYNLKIAIITGSKSMSVVNRFRKFKLLEDIVIGKDYKMEPLLDIIKKYNLKKEEVAYIGDDLIDLGPMNYVGLSFAPSDAIDDVKKLANIVLSKKGGEGVLRDSIDMILKSQNIYQTIVDYYTNYYNRQ